MTSFAKSHHLDKDIPVVGYPNQKNLLAYQATRGMIEIFNGIQMTLAESYINGLEVPDWLLKSNLNTLIPIVYKHFSPLLITYEWVLKESDRLAEDSQNLMDVQYNLPKELFQIMLGEGDMVYPKYTMALWEKGASNLEQAQKQMLDDAIEKAGIQDGDEILDLGCGFGCSCNYILSQFPHAKVTGFNLSHEQCDYMRNKMQDPNSYLSSDRFTLIEQDFNEANFETKFDKVIAIGLLEHIGNLTNALQKISNFLKDNGRAFIHIISVRLPHNIFNPFLNKYIFPRARAWHYDVIPSCDRHLTTISKWFLNGSNYSKTLSSWLKNFDENQEKIKTLDYGMDYQKFRRMWRLYLILCIALFSSCNGQVLGNGQYLLSKKLNT